MQVGRPLRLVPAILLSALLAFALFYSSFEASHALDGVLREYFPEVFFDVEAIERMLGLLRPIGCSALALTCTLIGLGFLTKRGYLAFLGSIAMYMPIFGYFAFAMFFLAGIGVLRALWLPLLELCPGALELGCIAYLPFMPLRNYALLIGMMFTWLGLFVFILGASTWLYGKFQGRKIIDFWIYRYSRHPQYLGFIIWSYGMLLFVSYKSYVRGALTTPPSLIWLISTVIVIGVALLEEIEMTKKYGEMYEEYRKKTPFMMPLPKLIARVITAPTRIAGGHPKSVKGVVAILALYTIILIALSHALTSILNL